jgi:hypothetical protein
MPTQGASDAPNLLSGSAQKNMKQTNYQNNGRQSLMKENGMATNKFGARINSKTNNSAAHANRKVNPV